MRCFRGLEYFAKDNVRFCSFTSVENMSLKFSGRLTLQRSKLNKDGKFQRETVWGNVHLHIRRVIKSGKLKEITDCDKFQLSTHNALNAGKQVKHDPGNSIFASKDGHTRCRVVKTGKFQQSDTDALGFNRNVSFFNDVELKLDSL